VPSFSCKRLGSLCSCTERPGYRCLRIIFSSHKILCTPDGGILDISDIASKAARSALAAPKYYLFASGTVLQSLADSYYIRRRLMTFISMQIDKTDSLRTFDTVVSSQWRFTSKTSDSFDGELHETSYSWRCDLNCPCVIPRYYQTNQRIKLGYSRATHINPKLFHPKWVQKFS
jgi:hypothetical protein